MCNLCIQNAASEWERHEAAQPGEVPISTGKTVWSTSQVINQLDSGSHWSGGTITFSFPANSSFFPYSNSEATGFSAFNSAQQAAALNIIGLWDDLIAPGFSLETNASSSDIKFSNTTTSIGYAHAYFPGGWSGAGSIWLNPQYSSLSDPDIGEYGFLTLMHEVGHALGLNHAGDYNGGNPTYENNASHAQDSHMFTIMSYFDAINTGADWVAGDNNYYDAQTPMVHDVLAIQAMYGADYSTRAGNTVYGFNSNTGSSIFDFSQNAHPVLTIWDGGGIDTIDVSAFSSNSIINLAPGSYSDVDNMTNNLAIAYGAWIENAVGGLGNDTITGNTLANQLQGNDGADTINGGGGSDTASYFGSFAAVTVNLWTGAAGGGHATGDTLVNIENLTGSENHDDRLAGNNAANILIGAGGNDRLYGFGGDDIVIGGTGDDRLYGYAGNDILTGGAGADVLDGRQNNDTASYSDSNAAVSINLSTSAASGGHAAGDTLIRIENLIGSDSYNDSLAGTNLVNTLDGANGSDRLYGFGGDDVLIGGGGNDRLYGYFGDDVLRGDEGADFLDGRHDNDTLFGGAGSDTFHFDLGGAHDTIKDFQNNIDQLELDNFTFATAAEALAFATEAGGDVTFNFGNGDILTIENISLARLSNDIEIV